MGQTRGQFEATVKANIPVCREHYRVVLNLDHFPQTNPGQFIQVACRDLSNNYCDLSEYDWKPDQPSKMVGPEITSPLAMLRRPFSLAGRRDVNGGVELDLIHRVVGVGTDWLSRLKVGDSVFVLGPLGNRFELPPKDGVALMVGGGVGIPPMMYLAEKLQGRKAIAFCRRSDARSAGAIDHRRCAAAKCVRCRSALQHHRVFPLWYSRRHHHR